MNNVARSKEAAGEAAARLVEDNMALGLGTGSTTAYAIKAIGKRVTEEGLTVQGIPTSFQAERLARQSGIPLATFDEIQHLDLAIDGADEVDGDLNLIKGGGGAHTREKVVASQALRFVVLIDESKIVTRLGEKMPVPLEVLPMAAPVVQRALHGWGMESELRHAERKSGPVVTDQGFWLLDVSCRTDADLQRIADGANNLPGVLDHGLFINMADDVMVGMSDGSVSDGLPV